MKPARAPRRPSRPERPAAPPAPPLEVRELYADESDPQAFAFAVDFVRRLLARAAQR